MNLVIRYAPQDGWAFRGLFSRSILMAPTFLGINDPITGDRPTPDDNISASTPRASTVPVAKIVCGAVGGAVALAVMLAFIYVIRVKRRVERLRRSTNVLGPELAPTPQPREIASINVIVSQITLVPKAGFDATADGLATNARSKRTPDISYLSAI
ncbi:hypothetical protein B0F90DRAFT_1818595 [Multifurca ochricompacta]|uniref:Uncharacterized protein n=1 Tax=Multifurca ochricompacta TaxID=376703 RepID=A0AAD4QL96_9AGAM|nr:hypothetical protein B0F90DRAFT_1818595 [Multifurca ochricompacta]